MNNTKVTRIYLLLRPVTPGAAAAEPPTNLNYSDYHLSCLTCMVCHRRDRRQSRLLHKQRAEPDRVQEGQEETGGQQVPL